MEWKSERVKDRQRSRDSKGSIENMDAERETHLKMIISLKHAPPGSEDHHPTTHTHKNPAEHINGPPVPCSE